LLRLAQQFHLFGGVALVFRTIRALPFRPFRLARRGQLDFVPLWRGLSSKAEELNRTLLVREVHHGNFGIIPVAEISWYSPATLLTLFWLFCQLEHQDASTCWVMHINRQHRSSKYK
jgi:hypothetical protein